MIHRYSIDSGSRKRASGILGVISVLISYFLYHYLYQFVFTYVGSYVWLISAPTPLAVYYLLHRFFDKWGWKIGFIRFILQIKIPNLNGEWKGRISSSYNNFRDKEATFQINQTWTSIEIIYRGRDSVSRSKTASIMVDRSQDKFLSYNYVNEPSGSAPESMSKHEGTALLTLIDDNKLKGRYYTGRDRRNHGEIELNKSKK